MSDLWLRLGLIGGALIVVAAVTLILRSRTTGRPRRLEATGLDPGVYLFTSATCPTCSAARRSLTGQVGESGFVEVSWEQDPATFDRLGIDAVPATAIISPGGSGTLWPGAPRTDSIPLGP